MNHKLLVALILGLMGGGTAAGTVYYVAVIQSVNYCSGLRFADSGKVTLILTNNNAKSVFLKYFRSQGGGLVEANTDLGPGISWESPAVTYVSGPAHVVEITTTTQIVADTQVLECQHKVSVSVPPAPESGQESLTLDTATMVNSTTFALNFRNQGEAAVTLTGYYVRDAGATGTYQRLSGWSGPTIQVNQVATVYIALTGGTWTGTSFSFQSGYPYRIQVQTARGTLLPASWILSIFTNFGSSVS